MPTLPVHNSQQNLNTSPSAPLRNEASQSFEQDRQVLGTMQEIAQRWSDANDVMQYTEASARHSLAVSDVQARASADPDFKNSDAYFKELDAVGRDAVKGISNQQVAGKAMLEFNYNADVAKIKIDSQFKQKQIINHQFTVKTEVEDLVRKQLSSSEAEALQYGDKIQERLGLSVQTGVLSLEQAEKILKDSQETAVKYDVYGDDSTKESDSQVLAELKDHKGKYAFLDPDTRLKMIKQAQDRIFQNNQTFKREVEIEKDARFQDIFQKKNDGTFTLFDLDKEQQDADNGVPGALSQKEILNIREGMIKDINSDLKALTEGDNVNAEAQKYREAIDNYISDDTDRMKGREILTKVFKFGTAKPKEITFLNQLKGLTEEVKTLQEREAYLSSKSKFRSVVASVNDFFAGKINYTESEKALAIKQLINSSADGEDPRDSAKRIIRESIINKNPEILNYSENGQLVVDANGNTKMMNNKGEYVDIKQNIKPEAKK